jgi:hypothetical protein
MGLLIGPLMSLLLMAGLGGCASYNRQVSLAMADYQRGQFAQAAQKLSATEPRSRDRLLWQLETGKAWQDAGALRRSNEDFNEADRMVEHFAGTADVRLGEEALVTIADQTARQYRGTPADRILLSTYLALNHLMLGDLELARVHLRRAYDRQREAVQRYRRTIEAAQRQQRRRGESWSPQGVVRKYDLHRRYSGLYAHVDQAYADYTNPLTTYLEALAEHLAGEEETARNLLQRVASLEPNNPQIRRTIGLGGFAAEARSAGEPMVYVVFETGMAPRREAFYLPILTEQAGYSALSLPVLQPREPSVGGLRLSPNDGSGGFDTTRTRLIADVNSIVATQFSHELPLIILSTVISLAAKEAATQALKKALEEDRHGRRSDSGAATALLIGSLYKAATSNPDLRTWRTPGAEFQIAHLPRPASGVLDLTLLGPTGSPIGSGGSVRLPEARASLVFIRCVGPGALSVQTAALPTPGRLEPILADPR